MSAPALRWAQRRSGSCVQPWQAPSCFAQKPACRTRRAYASSSSSRRSAEKPAPSSTSPSSAPGKKKAAEPSTEDTLAAVRSYRASPRGNPTSPPPKIKLTDKRANASAPDQQRKDVPPTELAEAASDAQQELEGGAQKMLRAGASQHPAAREQERQQAQENDTQSQQQQQQQQVSQGQEKGQTEAHETVEGEPRRREEKEQTSSGPREGVVIPSQTTFFGSTDDGQTASSTFRIRNDSSTAREDASPGGGDGGSGPPTTTAVGSQIPDLGQTRPPRIEYPFNTHIFIKRLQEAGFTKPSQAQGGEADQSTSTRRHDPSESIMELTKNSLVDRGEHVVQYHMNKTEAENQAYLFTAALSELRTEVQVRARNDAAALRSTVTLLQREVDGLSQKMREDVAAMKHDIQVDMNNRKGEAKEEQNTLEQEIQDLNNRFTISISDLKTEIEQNIKWDATRRALTVVFGSVVILIGTLAAADYFGKSDEVEEAPGMGQRAEIKITRSAEELGLLPNYDEEKDDGSRYV